EFNYGLYYLKETDLNMTEIAMRCGFDSINYFSRLFKRRRFFNCTSKCIK
ncbi:MAG: AraC family transcriptional regulator, partial [Clostridioides difficile]|nr:AraC family transcriptional regulator [Clostridioides difficile]